MTQPLNSDEQTLHALEREFFTAVMRRDRATVERLATPTFIATGFNGRSVDVAAYIQVHFAPEHEFVHFDPQDARAYLYGDAAVLNGHMHIEDAKSGRGMDYYRYTTTWVRQAGTWCLAAYQETTLLNKPA